MGPPEVIAFDVVETLFSLAPLADRLASAGGGPATLELWFARVLSDGFALTASGGYRPFGEVAEAALRDLLPAAADDAVEHVLGGLSELDAHPDSAPAMGRAVQGARVIVVTNGGAAATRTLLERGGLDAFVEAVVSVDEVGAWKPAPYAYRRAAAVAGVAPEQLALVAVHPWDVHGAGRAGLLTGWCNRRSGRFPSTFDAADVEGPDLVAVVEGLLGLAGDAPG